MISLSQVTELLPALLPVLAWILWIERRLIKIEVLLKTISDTLDTITNDK